MRRGKYGKNRFYRFNTDGYTYINPNDLVSNGLSAPIEAAPNRDRAGCTAGTSWDNGVFWDGDTPWDGVGEGLCVTGSGEPWDNSTFWDNNEGWT